MDDMKLLSTEAEGVNEAVPEEHRKALVNAAGRVGALLGLQSADGDGAGSPPETDDDDVSTGEPRWCCSCSVPHPQGVLPGLLSLPCPTRLAFRSE